ncbi:MAG: carbon starvation CstA family protein [Endomicrobiia bacterium]
MTIYILVVICIFVLAYFIYANFLERNLEIKETEEVPSQVKKDGVDFVPTNRLVLLGHHFSSIAGAGPIVGPIFAGFSFGWVPTLLWIVIGAIFIGGVHDFCSLVISVRHQGKSIAEIANKYIDKTTYKVLLVFIWFSLMYVVAVFADIAADTFSSNASVAQVSMWYVGVAVLFGVLVYRVKFDLVTSTVIALILILLGIVFNLNFKIIFLSKNIWIWILLLYCIFASVLPVWFLLQPRDYLSSYFLYFSVLIGILGLIFGKNKILYPGFVSFYSGSVGPLFPFIFITVACGAISGFHSLVASGTTSKQLDNIKNAKFVSYGGMILEGIVAAVSLSTLMMLPFNTDLKNPQQIYASGLSKFINVFGIEPEIGKTIGFLTISAFILTTLDTATRISRYIFQELIEKHTSSLIDRIVATLVSLLLPFILLSVKIKDASGNIVPCWRIIWPLFGATNQLLAALVLLVVFVWFKKQNYKGGYSISLPMIFMVITTLSALVYTIYVKIFHRIIDISIIMASILTILAIFVIIKSIEKLSIYKKV